MKTEHCSPRFRPRTEICSNHLSSDNLAWQFTYRKGDDRWWQRQSTSIRNSSRFLSFMIFYVGFLSVSSLSGSSYLSRSFSYSLPFLFLLLSAHHPPSPSSPPSPAPNPNTPAPHQLPPSLLPFLLFFLSFTTARWKPSSGYKNESFVPLKRLTQSALQMFRSYYTIKQSH